MIPDAGEGARLPEGDRSLFKLLSVTPNVACFLCLDAKGQVAVIVEVKTSHLQGVSELPIGSVRHL